MTCDIRFLVSGYGNPFETSISLIRADLSAGSFSVEQKFTGPEVYRAACPLLSVSP